MYVSMNSLNATLRKGTQRAGGVEAGAGPAPLFDSPATLVLNPLEVLRLKSRSFPFSSEITELFSTLFRGGDSQGFLFVVVKVARVAGTLALRDERRLDLKERREDLESAD